jgi:hypothetical protein
MKRIIKNSLSTLTGYFITMIIYGIFSYAFLSIAGDNVYKWLPLYSGFFFLIIVSMIYTDYKKMAIREKRPQYELFPKPIDGLKYGLIGEIPLIILIVIGIVIRENPNTIEDLKLPLLNGMKIILGPFYIIYKISGNSYIGFILVFIFIPLLTMGGYSAGLFNIEIMQTVKKKYRSLKEIVIDKLNIEKDA